MFIKDEQFWENMVHKFQTVPTQHAWQSLSQCLLTHYQIKLTLKESRLYLHSIYVGELHQKMTYILTKCKEAFMNHYSEWVKAKPILPNILMIHRNALCTLSGQPLPEDTPMKETDRYVLNIIKQAGKRYLPEMRLIVIKEENHWLVGCDKDTRYLTIGKDVKIDKDLSFESNVARLEVLTQRFKTLSIMDGEFYRWMISDSALTPFLKQRVIRTTSKLKEVYKPYYLTFIALIFNLIEPEHIPFDDKMIQVVKEWVQLKKDSSTNIDFYREMKSHKIAKLIFLADLEELLHLVSGLEITSSNWKNLKTYIECYGLLKYDKEPTISVDSQPE